MQAHFSKRMTSPANQDASHPLAKSNLPLLKLLQAQGQTVGTHGYHMQITNFLHWGFVIYRCDYSDDDLFVRFIAYLREQAERYHQRAKQDRTTGLYLRWTIVEDRERLDGATKDEATKDEARERFVVWRDGLSTERDGPGADHRVTRSLPQFEFCVHVGKDSLESLEAYEKASGQRASASPPVFFALVRAMQKLEGLPEDYDPNEADGDDEYDEDPSNDPPAVERSTEHDVGWMYIEARYWVTLYEELHGDQAWYILYTRPPAIAQC